MLAFYCADDNNPDTDCIKKLIEKYSMFGSISNILAEDIKVKIRTISFPRVVIYVLIKGCFCFFKSH